MFENFRRVAVREKIVGPEIFIHFGELEIAPRVFACSRGAGLAIANNAGVGSKPARLRKRPQGKNHAGGITAGVRNESSPGNFARIKLRNAVDSLRKPVGVGRGKFVPGSESFRFTKAESSAQIDDAQTGTEQIGRQFRGDLMRSRKKRRARAAGSDRIRRKWPERRFAPSAELGKDFGEAFRTIRLADIEGRRRKLGMAQQNAR